MKTKAFVTVQEVAKALGLTKGAVYRMISIRAVEAKNFGEHCVRPTYRIPASEIGRLKKMRDAGLPIGVRQVPREVVNAAG